MAGPARVSTSLEWLEARRAQRRKAAARRRRRRRLLLAGTAIVGLLVWAVGSYSIWMLKPTSMSFEARSVEWVRADVPFGNTIVDDIERVYYTANAPKKGGPTPKRLPALGLSQPRGRQSAAWPPRIKPVFAHPLPGEGVWKPTGPPVDGGPPVLVTSFRPEVEYPELLAYVAWFDHTRTAIAYYPGRYEPPNAAVRGPMMVPYDQRWRLRATFNGGFTYEDGENGSTVDGQVNEPLKDGKATLVGYRDGRVEIVKWNGGPNAGPDVAWARQSLAPIVWNGRLNPALNEDPNSPEWGFTLGGVTRVWRSGVGIDRRGDLMFVAAEGQTVISIARILQHIGAVRAMEFDINPDWHTLITYTHDHELVPKMIEPQPNQSANRYLVPDDRDFFAVYQRLPGPVTDPLR
ncbi:MAG TPA: phosphodiester glycosidase family protein [Solirubrobacteraceae bacterium]|nr:phosphodiester glycosidase family protein [Solirubrobacteraceae bacterium]